MTDQKQICLHQEPEDYRASLVYTQEYGYKMVTITIHLASDEQSRVISHAYDLPVSQEAEHLQSLDLYHFAVMDGVRIQLIIEAPTGRKKEAWYTVHTESIFTERSSIDMDILCSDEGVPYQHLN